MTMTEARGPARPVGKVLRPGRNVWRLAAAERARVLVDGAAYFGALRETLLAARHRVVVVGWDIDSRMRLVGEAPPEDGLPAELAPFLRALVEREPALSVKLLLWKSSLIYALERDPAVDFALQWRTPPQVELHFDDELPAGSAQHQKIVVVDDAVAFCGGLDLAIRRWDTPHHRLGDPDRVDPAGKPYPPFHDVQMMVDGEAAAALGELAAERWRNATHESLPPLPPSTATPWPAAIEPDFRGVSIGIARTVPACGGATEVREVERLFADMIDAAEETIYLENQFLTCLPLAERIARRMRLRPRLEVLTVAPRRHHTWIEHATMQVGRNRFVEIFEEAGLADRIAVVAQEIVEGEQHAAVMIHAKVMIVDDRLLRIGSANLANRSMGADSECDLVVEAGSEAERRTIRRLRDTLVAEHCGTSPEAVAAAVAERGSLLAAVAALEGRSRLVPIDSGSEAGLGLEWLADPERPLAEVEPIAAVGGSRKRPRRRRRLIAVAALVLACLAGAAAWRFGPGTALADPQALAGQLQVLPGGVGEPMFVAGAFVVAGLVAFPVTLLIAATAIAFGAWPGIAYAALGALASAITTYLIGRALGPDALRDRMGPRMTRLREVIAERGVLAVACVRLMPVAPFSIVNLVAGALRVPFVDYVVGTLLGLAPGLVLLTALGDRILAAVREPTLGAVAVLVAVVVAWGLMSVGVQILVSRWRSRR